MCVVTIYRVVQTQICRLDVRIFVYTRFNRNNSIVIQVYSTDRCKIVREQQKKQHAEPRKYQ